MAHMFSPLNGMIIKRCEMNSNDLLVIFFTQKNKTTAQENKKRKPHRGEKSFFHNSVVIGWEWFEGKVINEWRGWACIEFLFVDWTIVDVAWRTFDWLNVRVTITGAKIGDWLVLPSP